MSIGSQEEAAIRKLVADADSHQGEVEPFTDLLTENVVIVNIAGIRVSGRDEFKSLMAAAMESRLANVRTRTEVEGIASLRPDVALVSCVKHVFDENADATEDKPSRGALTFVVVREDAGWRIALIQTTPMLI